MTLNLEIKTDFADDYHLAEDESLDSNEPLEQILIVDDEEIVRRFHCECLSSRYACLESASAEDALEILRNERISLVITDWVMTGMSGKMLLRRIVQDFPDTFVIMVSGIDHAERSLDAIRSGAFDYILKPSTPELLELTVERALAFRDFKIKARQHRIDLELQSIELAKQKEEIKDLRARLETAEDDHPGKTSSVETSDRFADQTEIA